MSNDTLTKTAAAAKFFPGQILMTPGALDAFKTADDFPRNYLVRHLSGDWGEMSEGDKRENDFSVENGFRVFSAYHLKDGEKIWIITEADRSATTILLPEEY